MKDFAKDAGGFLVAALIGAGMAYGTTQTIAAAISGAASMCLLYVILFRC